MSFLAVTLAVSAALVGVSSLGEATRQKFLCAALAVTEMAPVTTCGVQVPLPPAPTHADGPLVALTSDPGVAPLTSNLVTRGDRKGPRWSPEKAKDLTWCVTRETCGDRTAEVVDAMNAASKAWSDTGACFAFRFEGDCGPEFPVPPPTKIVIKCGPLPGDVDGRTLSGLGETIILDLPKLDDEVLPFVVAHEVGHSLGFGHEHDHPDAACKVPALAAKDTNPLTAYDPTSVMHYACGENGGSAGRWISERDAEGAVAAYGRCHPTVTAPPPRLGGDDYGRGVGWVPRACPPDREYTAGLCYPKGGSGLAAMPSCEPWAEYDAGLCYTPCVQGFHGVGPVCWRD